MAINFGSLKQQASAALSSAASQARNSVSPQASAAVNNLLGSAASFGQGLIGQAGDAVKGIAEDVFSAKNFMSLLRGGGLPKFGMPGAVGFSEVSWQGADNDDWRVRLSLPPGMGLEPTLSAALAETSGMIFPYTPSIIMSHSANYSQVKPTHSNYPFPVYQSSQPDNIQISGDFIIESESEGVYWVAMVHYLRTVTKMSYGNSSNQGSPPPVVQLNGYGDYVFKNVPVVVQQFTCELPPDVDYIYIKALDTWAPTRCNVSVILMPTYSRRAVQQFSLDKFVSGGYAKGNGQGFI
jgi:hypothetical protein